MKKTFFIITALTIMYSGIQAQVTIQPNLPTVGMLQKNQLWNVMVINSSGQQYDCRLDLVARDRSTGQEVFTAMSNQFSIAKGSKQLNVNLLNPVQYNYLTPNPNNNPQGLMPVGSYTICYTLISIPSNETNLAEECASFDAEPLSPPMLIYPADSAELDLAPTQFTWLPPTPAAMFDMLQYEVLITEINQGQQANEAIQENPPFYSTGNDQNSFLNYPASSKEFEKEKWYAWQVVAKDDKNYAAKSETWVFRLKPVSVLTTVVEQSPFIKMKKGNPEKGIAPNGVLKISYVNETADSMVTVKIFDRSTENKNIPQFTIAVKAGENLIQYNLKKILPVREGNVYEAVIINSRIEKWSSLFEVRSYDDKKKAVQ